MGRRWKPSAWSRNWGWPAGPFGGLQAETRFIWDECGSREQCPLPLTFAGSCPACEGFFCFLDKKPMLGSKGCLLFDGHHCKPFVSYSADRRSS